MEENCGPIVVTRRERHVSIFFSSRRRHTRFDCDWSSDVCSSDLAVANGTQCGDGDTCQAGVCNDCSLSGRTSCYGPGTVFPALATSCRDTATDPMACGGCYQAGDAPGVHFCEGNDRCNGGTCSGCYRQGK